MDEKWIVNGLNFSKEEKLRFLEHIKERPGIWDYKISYQHKFQKRKEFIDKKVKAWDEITDIYGGKDLSAENRQDLNALLQRKWRMMRDNYVKIYKSNNQKYKNDPLFLAINSFLMEITEENMRIRSKYKFGQKRTKISDDVMRNDFKEGDDSNDNIGSRRNFEEEGENNETLGNDDDGIDLGKSTCGELDVPIELELNVDDENNPFGNMLENYKQNFEQPREQDECDVFGQFVAVKLRKLDAEARSRLQFLIHQTIFNEENSIASSRKRVRRIS